MRLKKNVKHHLIHFHFVDIVPHLIHFQQKMVLYCVRKFSWTWYLNKSGGWDEIMFKILRFYPCIFDFFFFLLPFKSNFYAYEIFHNTSMGLSMGKIESVFGHFTKFNIRKTDASQNSVWKLRTLHKLQYEENGLFTKFNSVYVYGAPIPHFLEIKNAPCPFLEVKNKPFPFLEVKSKPCPFSTISRGRKLDSSRKSRNAIWKICVRKIPALKNSRFCSKTPFCF